MFWNKKQKTEQEDRYASLNVKLEKLGFKGRIKDGMSVHQFTELLKETIEFVADTELERRK